MFYLLFTSEVSRLSRPSSRELTAINLNKEKEISNISVMQSLSRKHIIKT